jgi:hypothetical protein
MKCSNKRDDCILTCLGLVFVIFKASIWRKLFMMIKVAFAWDMETMSIFLGFLHIILTYSFLKLKFFCLHWECVSFLGSFCGCGLKKIYLKKMRLAVIRFRYVFGKNCGWSLCVAKNIFKMFGVVFRNVVAVAFQSAFYVEMHQNNIFLFLKNYFLYQCI